MKPLTFSQILVAVGGTTPFAQAHQRRTINGVAIDSRGDLTQKLFVPLKGEHVDGHDFLNKAFENNATIALSEKDHDGTLPIIKVRSTPQALKDLAQYYHGLLNIKTVAITGSVGKTTTKDMIASVLAQKYSVLKTEGNFNNEIGLPLTIFKLEETHQYAVLEMGMNHFGEIGALSAIAKPDICIITNIGVSHIENLGSREGILKAKSEIFDHMRPNGVVILNGDDPRLQSLKTQHPHAIFYGLNRNHNHIFAENLVPNGITDTACTVTNGNEQFRLTVPFPGEHMVQNALAAVAVGSISGITAQAIATGIKNAPLTKMRMDISQTKTGITLINDAYNASPQSMKAAINILKQSTGRTVCVLGDMFELGNHSRTMHEAVGQYAAEYGIDVLIFIGEASHHAYTAAKQHTHNPCHYFKTKEQLIPLIFNYVKSGDTVLVKASRGMALETIANLF